jgi:hypothetical protein
VNSCFVAVSQPPCDRPLNCGSADAYAKRLCEFSAALWNYALPAELKILYFRRVGAPGRMSQDEYKRRALECIASARLVKDPDQAALLLGMAQAWLRLADYVLMFRDTADIAVIATQTETDQEE